MQILRYVMVISLLAFTTAANSASVQVNVSGTLGEEVLSLHAGYGGAPFNGYFEIDLDDRLIQSGNSNPYYNMTAWSITVVGTIDSLLLESSGETLDDGTLTLSQSASINRVTLLIDEDIDGALDRTLRLYFDPVVDLSPQSKFEDLSVFNFIPDGSLLQFSTSQGPMNVESANISAVPIPAAAWMFGSALLGLGVFKHRRA